jgi:hypothetical protein
MATSIERAKLDYNFRPVQITGPANASIANYISFDTPAEVRRVEVVTATEATLIQVFIDRDDSGDPEQQVLLAQTSPYCPNHRWLVHEAPFRVEDPQNAVQEPPNRGGKVYLVTVGGGNWSLTVEAKG